MSAWSYVTKKEDHQEEDPDTVSAIITQLQLPNLAKKKGKKREEKSEWNLWRQKHKLVGYEAGPALTAGRDQARGAHLLSPTNTRQQTAPPGGGKNQILCRLKGADLDKGGRKCRCRSDERGGRGEELCSQPCSGGEVESELCRRRPEARPKAAPSKLPRKGPRHQHILDLFRLDRL